MKPAFWVADYRGLEIHDSRMGHWGRGQTGFNLSESGRVFLSDGRKIKRDRVWAYPCHRDLVNGHGLTVRLILRHLQLRVCRRTVAMALSGRRRSLNEAMKLGLHSLVGVHRIDGQTPVPLEHVAGAAVPPARRWRQIGQRTSGCLKSTTLQNKTRRSSTFEPGFFGVYAEARGDNARCACRATSM